MKMIRKAEYEDVPRIMEICADSRRIMRSDGNMTQWTGGYPSEDVISSDISRSVGYIIEDDGIPYCTIHRLASTISSHGIAETCFRWCWERSGNLRVDTHEDNRIMRHCIEKFGFVYCGVIYLQNGDPRLAYQKV